MYSIYLTKRAALEYLMVMAKSLTGKNIGSIIGISFQLSTVIFFLSFSQYLSAQESTLPLGSEGYPILERMRILSGAGTPYHTALKGYCRKDAAAAAVAWDTMPGNQWSKLDRSDLRYLFRDNNEWFYKYRKTQKIDAQKIIYTDSSQTLYSVASETDTEPDYFETRDKPLLKALYKTPAHFYELHIKDFFFSFNPVINLQGGGMSGEGKRLMFYNQRGAEMRWSLDDKIYFYSQILEHQARFPDYVNQYVTKFRVVPGASFVKRYTSPLLGIENGYDFLNAQAYLGANVTRHFGFQLGHGRNFIGDGYRSMILSDFSAPYFYLKLNWRIWKFHYQNIFTELAARTPQDRGPNEVVPKKYAAMHHISFNITPKLNVGLFETVVFQRDKGFELQYLNPVILYRTIEGALGSPDNVLLGGNFRWDFLKRFQLYGQMILDEFKFDELFIKKEGWWANKFGTQLGLKYINAFGLDHLDVQVEYNAVRPYTYTHRDTLYPSSYSHYNQPLAHPLGANFKEFLTIVRYRPVERLQFTGRLLRYKTGEDGAGQNWGSNILLSHFTREQDYGNFTGQGIETKVLLLGLEASYTLGHNIYFDLQYQHRKKDSAEAARDLTTRFVSAGFRMNIAPVRWDF